jgi:branched-chain amino acid transport system ATP-binding protein
VYAGYGGATVLRNVDLDVPTGSVVALLGANGAGKTTLLRSAAGLVRAQQGSVAIDGADHTRSAPFKRVRAGVCLIPEGRGIWRSLTVRANLRLQVPPWLRTRGSLDEALEAFPALGKKLDQQAGTLSGGQQQMVALCRAYLSKARVVLLDEVSMGLAPRVVDEIFESLAQLARTGVSLLLVEQYVERALDLADNVILLRRGEVAFSGPPSDLDQEALVDSYLGQGEPLLD